MAKRNKRNNRSKAKAKTTSVAQRRASGTNKAAKNQAAKAKVSQEKSVTKPPKTSVADNRKAAAAANQSMKEYKTANNITPKYTSAERQSTATQTNGNIGTYDPNSVGKKEGGKYSHNDIKALRSQGYSDSDIGKHLESLGGNGNLGAAASRLKQKYVDSLKGSTGIVKNPIDQSQTGESDNKPNNPATPTTSINQPTYPGGGTPPKIPSYPGVSTSTPTIGTGGVVQTPDNSQELNVNQDNDITTAIDGHNNTVVNNQDNSIRQYGGDNRTFNYSGGTGNPYEDTPVSAATAAGFYAVDDSPAAQAKFNDLHTTLNRDNQKRYAGMGLATAAMFGNHDARSYTDESMTNAINRSTQYSYDKADVQTGIALGDIWRPDYAPDWRMPEAPDPIESNVENITEKAKDDIEDM